MVTHVDKRLRRQKAYAKRSRSARFFARVLMPVAMVTLSTSIWSDPVWGPKLAEGVEEVKPMVATYLADTPFADMLGPVEVTQPVDDPSQGNDDVRVEASLSQAIRP
ncbi:MAG: hypothetical protein AB8B47_02130 [Roseobacter sp.]